MRTWRAALLAACAFSMPVPAAHATWLPGAPVDSTGGALHSVALGTAADGSSVVAWVAADAAAGHSRLDVAVLSGSTWSVHTALDTGTSDVGHPSVAVGSGGRGVVTFVQSDGDHQRLWAVAISGGTFAAPVVVDAGTRDVQNAAVVIDDAGAATVAFVQYTGARLRVLASRGTGGTWGTPAFVDTGAGTGNAVPTLAVSQAGGGVGIAFLEGSGALFHAFVARWSGATWTPPAAIDTGAGDGNVLEIGLAMTSPAAGVAAWTQELAGRRRVYGAAMAGGVWSLPNLLDPTTGPPGYVVPTGDAATPAVAADPVSDTAVVVWTQATSGRSRVFSARLATGLWQASTPLDAPDGGDAANPAVAIVGPLGDGATIWYGWDATAGEYHIFAASLANGLWSAPHDLGPATGVPVIAIDGTGSVLALWIDAGQVVQATDDHTPPTVGLADCTIYSGHDTAFAIGPSPPSLPCLGPDPYLAQATDDLSGVARVLWDFGDGTTSENATQLHHYVKSGSYQLRLSAWDGAGNTAAAVATVTVEDHDGPILSAGSDLDVDVGAVVTFATDPVDPDAGLDESSISWDVGDGGPAMAGRTVTHVYTAPGTYQVSVSASDLAVPPNTSTDTALVHVHTATAPSAPGNVSALRNPTNAAPQLTWDAVYNADHYDVYRGGVRIATVAAPARSFTDRSLTRDGTYAYGLVAVTRTALSSPRSPDLAVAYDTVAPAPAIAPLQLGTPGVPLHLAVSADEPLASASWDLGDHSTATGFALDHTYAVAGTYRGSVEVADRAGNLARVALTFTISNRLAASAGPNLSGRVGDTMTFDGSASGAWVSARWSFGDGGSATTLDATHVYRRAGAYRATLSVSDGTGRTVSDEAIVEIAVRGAPLVRILPVPASFAGDHVPFRGLAAPGDGGARIVSTWWVFGDGAKRSGARVTHVYRRARRYVAYFYARDSKNRLSRARIDLPVARLSVRILHATRSGAVLSLQLRVNAPGIVTFRITRGSRVDTVRRSVRGGVHAITVRLRATRHGHGRSVVSLTLRRRAGAQARAHAGFR